MQNSPLGRPQVCPRVPWNQEIPKYHFLPLFSHPLSYITSTEKIQVLRIKWIGWNIFRRCLNALWICWLFLIIIMDTYVRKCFDLIVTLWISPGNLDLVKTRIGSVSICIFNTVIIPWSSLPLNQKILLQQNYQSDKFKFMIAVLGLCNDIKTILLPLSILETYLFYSVWYIFNDIPSEKSACMSLDLN